jgi:ABC-type nitrate/sulfonate/bicarbonate transport system substrate-binding protein
MRKSIAHGLCGWTILFAIMCAQVSFAFGAETIRIAFPSTPNTTQLPYFVAQKKGWLKDVQITETYVTGDSNAVRAVLSGNADLAAVVGTFSVFTAMEAGADLRAISSWQPVPDYNVVLAAGKGSKISDLAGKIFASSGPGGLPDQLPRILMRKHQVDASTTRFVQVGGHPARLQAVLGGRADATLVNSITSVEFIEAGRVTLVAKIAEEFPKMGLGWNVVRAQTLNDPKMAEPLQILTTAGIRASRFILQNPDEAAAILHERIPTIGLELAKRVVRDLNKDGVWGDTGGADLPTAEFSAKLCEELGVIKKPIATSTLIDERFIKVALSELGSGK